MGRPSDYTPELADAICAKLVEGQSLRAICRDEVMPGLTTVFGWLRKHEEFAQQYTRAREEQADTLADELVEIADEVNYEAVLIEGETVAVRFDAVAVARNKLRVETRKWAASKLKPRVYGDRQTVEHTGKVGLEQLVAGDAKE